MPLAFKQSPTPSYKGIPTIINALKGSTALKSLNLWHDGIGPEGAKATAEALPFNTGFVGTASNGLLAVHGALIRQ